MRSPPPPPTARPSTQTSTSQRATSAIKSQLDGARALLSMLIDASTSSAPPVPDGTSAPSSTASTAAATVPADSATLVFELARAEANTLAKQSTETWPQVNVPTVLEYDMKNYGQWRRWFHNQAALHDCVTALTYEPPAAPPLGRKIWRVRNLMQILVASVDETLLHLTGDSDSVVITLDNLRRRAPSPGSTVDALLVQAAHSPRTCQTSPLIFKITRLSTGPSFRRPQGIWRPIRPSN
jgi:hypothetical protein